MRFDEQAVLCQEPGKEHPMPALAGTLADQVVDGKPAGGVPFQSPRGPQRSGHSLLVLSDYSLLE